MNKFRIVERQDGKFVIQKRVLWWWYKVYITDFGRLQAYDEDYIHCRHSVKEAEEAIRKHIESKNRKGKELIRVIKVI
jgi:hypothetical protein